MVTRAGRALVLGGLFIACLTTAALAQTNPRITRPYEQAERAFRGKRFAEAIKLLQEAIANDSRKGEQRQIPEGTFTIQFKPYYLLVQSHVGLGQFAEAQQYVTQARVRLNAEEAANLKQHEQTIAMALKPPPPRGTPAPNAQFAANLRSGESALAARRFREAIDAFDAARSADAAEYTRQNVQTQRDQATRGLALVLVEQGRQQMSTSLPNARTSVEEAQRLVSNLPEATSALAEIAKLEEAERTRNQPVARGGGVTPGRQTGPGSISVTNTPIAGRNSVAGGTPTGTTTTPISNNPPPADANRLYEDAMRASKDGRYADAEAGFRSATQRDPNHKAAQGALQRSQTFSAAVTGGRTARDRGDTAGARRQFEEAKRLDTVRFNREGLDTVLAALTTTIPADPLREPLRLGMQALLRGDAQGSIAILQPAAGQKGAQPTQTAAVHAWLGVAYATRALASSNADEQTKLRGTAVEQFRLALASDRSFQLSPRLVSPRILAIFDEARR